MSAQVRSDAINPAGSFLVQAPAGSGKTELLTRRILKLLAVVNEPEEILALTFTRKAAAEMRSRVIEALAMAKPEDPASHKMETWQLARAVNARSKERGWHLAEHPSRLRLMTLDSFTHALASQMPLLSGLGDMPVPSSHAQPIYRQAAEVSVNMLMRQHPEQAEAVLLHQDHNLVGLIKLLADMLAKRDQWLHQVLRHKDDMAALRLEQEQSLAEIMGQQLNHCAQLIPVEVKSRMPELIRFAGEHLDRADLKQVQHWPDASLEALSSWQLIADMLLLKGKAGFRKSVTKTNGFPPGKENAQAKQDFLQQLATLTQVPGLDEALHGLRVLPAEPRFDDAQWRVLEGLFSLLLLAATQLQRQFEQHGEADFIEIALRALQALEDEQGNPTDLLLRLDYRIHHILVDEFQDTSQLQMRLLQSLSEGWQSGDGTHRTLFMVGDPMQSIYRFRKAEVSLFLLAAANRVGLPAVQALHLTRNFRSSPVIVDWVNRAFANIFPAEPDILLAAVGHAEAKAALSHDGSVCLYLQQQNDALIEARAVVETIRRELKTEDRNIAVLARSRRHLHLIMQQLQQADIAFSAVDILPLSARPEIRMLRALLRALLHSADRESWAALLRGPCCGLDTRAMHQLLAADQRPVAAIMTDPERLKLLDEESRLRVDHLSISLQPCLRLAGRINIRSLLELAVSRLSITRMLDAESLKNMLAMYDLVEELDEAGLISFALLDERLEKLYATADVSAAAKRVELLTMHGAKGLQWDVVILPGLGHSGAQSDTPLIAMTEVPARGGTYPLIAARAAVRSSDAIYDIVRNVEKTRENNELSRLLYVACTRAETTLHMFGHVSEQGDAKAGSLLKLLLPEGVDSGCFGASVEMLDEDVTAQSQSGKQLQRVQHLPEPVSIASDDEIAESEYFWAGAEAAPVGNAVHAGMQYIADKGFEHWSNEETSKLSVKIRRSLMADGLSGLMLEHAKRRCGNAIETVLDSRHAAWILSAEHLHAHSEWALSQVRNGAVSHHIIDRSFIDADGVRWIIDYKTATHEGGGREKFLDEEVKRHAPQLQRYADILARMEPQRKIRCALYFPMLDAWKEVAT